MSGEDTPDLRAELFGDPGNATGDPEDGEDMPLLAFEPVPETIWDSAMTFALDPASESGLPVSLLPEDQALPDEATYQPWESADVTPNWADPEPTGNELDVVDHDDDTSLDEQW